MANHDVDLSVGLDRQEIPEGDGAAELKCHFELRQASSQGTEVEGPVRTSICLVFDCSASMAGDRIEAAVRAAHLIVDSTKPGNTLSLVAFERRSHILVADVEVTEVHRGAIKRQIETLHQFVRGSTNMAAGIRQGTEIVRNSHADAKVMILLSDGVASNPRRAVAAAATAAQEGIQVFAVGLGPASGEEHLLNLVAPSNGTVFREQDADRVLDAFSTLVARIDRIAATNAYLDVTLATDVVPGRVERILPDRALLGTPLADANGVFRLTVGNLERGQSYRFELPVRVPARGARNPKLLHVKFGYDVAALGIRNRTKEATLLLHCHPKASREPPGLAAPPRAKAPRTRSYGVVLTDTGPNLIMVYRAIREATGNKLRDVKDRLRDVDRPIQEGLERSEAEALKKCLEAVGAQVKVRLDA